VVLDWRSFVCETRFAHPAAGGGRQARRALPLLRVLGASAPPVILAANLRQSACVIMSNMSSFSEKGLLGELEQLVLLAVMNQEADAYAVSIRDEIEARTAIALARGSVYVTLDRLDRKGYVTSWMGEPTAERGGKAKRCFRITPAGRRALAAAESALARMRDAKPARSPR